MSCSEKLILRKKCKTIRKTIDTRSVSGKICGLIKKWDVFNNARNIMLFYPIGSELSLLELLNIDGKNFYFPCVTGDDLSVACYESSDCFISGKYDIMEPDGVRLDECSFLDLVFVPALAVDLQGNRLGYGKGYYDKFLSKYPSLVSAVPVCSELCFEKIPAESHDIKVDYLITENDIIRP